MPSLTIPTRYHPALREIKESSVEAVEQLISALQSAPLSGNASDLATSIGNKVSGVETPHLARMIEALLALYMVRASSETAPDIFVKDVIRAMNESDEPGLLVASDQLPAMKDRLTRLLGVDVLNTVVKAVSLRGEHPQTFCDARILTDIRPVFGVDTLLPVSAVITHTLKVEYHRQHEHREFYLALDAADLKNLASVIARAQLKAKALQDMLKNTGLADLEMGD